MLLQRIETLVPAEIAPLFVSTDKKAGSRSTYRLVEETCVIDRGTVCSFDSYFGSFWENYWFDFTELKSVYLLATVHGTGTVRVLRRTPQLDTYVLGEMRFDSDTEPTTVRLDVRDDADFRGQAGRIWMEIMADEQVQLVDAGWHTDQAPVRDVSLNVVFTTFNRVEYLSRVVQALDKDPQCLDSVGQVTIINQGNEFGMAELLPDPAPESTLRDKLVVIPQANMGGCGGFTRGMVTTLADESLTHVLLLDDDIRMHTDSLARAGRFLAFAKNDVALGGHMLNLHRPLMVYEAGAQLDPVTTKPVPCDLESAATTKTDLDTFLTARTVAFNGWWFFGTSRAQLERVGLPLPCFIRGDDVEFGVRLREFGERTVSVPGIAVWHEPFYMKLGGWQYYFETRNRLESASIHGIGNWPGIRRNLFGSFVRDVAMARYHSVMYMITGIEDYLAGPDVAISTDDSALKRCIAIAEEYGPTRIAETMPVSEPPKTVLNRVETRLPGSGYFARAHTAATSLTRLVRVRKLSEVPTFHSTNLQPDVVSGLDQYRVQEEFGNGVWLYQRRPELERELWKRAVALIRQVEPLGVYREAFESSDYWRSWWDSEFGSGDTASVRSADVA